MGFSQTVFNSSLVTASTSPRSFRQSMIFIFSLILNLWPTLQPVFQYSDSFWLNSDFDRREKFLFRQKSDRRHVFQSIRRSPEICPEALFPSAFYPTCQAFA